MSNRHSFVVSSGRYVLVLALLGGLVGCGDKNSASEASVSPSSAVVSADPGSEALSPPRSAAPAAVPVASYAPTAAEVKHAFHQILLQKAMSMPQGQERDQWFVQETQRIDAMQVGRCSQTPVGTPSECFVSISGNTVKFQLLLTQSGWVIVG